jgi:pimeloyl-ACP methyl ester carboxylesterase
MTPRRLWRALEWHVTEPLSRRASSVKRRLLPSFRRSVEDPAVPLSLDMNRESRTLLIAFGGMAGGLGMPPFEMFKATGDLPVKRVFVRDLHQAWYHRGIPGSGDSISEVADSLERLIAPHEIDRLVAVGTSAGGYAALLFGTLLGAHTAIAFGPQTVLDLEILAGMGDHRWDPQVKELEALGCLDEQWVDLRSALPRIGRTATRYQLHFDPLMALDRAHCERLADLDRITLHLREGAGHNIARDMREAGELEPLLRGALGEPAAREMTSGA